MATTETRQQLSRRERWGMILGAVVIVACTALAVINATQHSWGLLASNLLVGFGAGCTLYALTQQRHK